MSRIFLTGDIHGSMSISKLSSKLFKEGKNLTKDDYVIILGDFGLLWKDYPDAHEIFWRTWLDNKPWTTLVVDGNHENHQRINNLIQVNKFGTKIKKLSESIFFLNRGEVYTINNKKFFVMGGAYSIDKKNRTPYVSWWYEEIPTVEQFETGLKNLEKNQWDIDYILGHTAPLSIIKEYAKSGIIKYDLSEKYDSVSKYFDSVIKLTNFKRFFFGHFHDEWSYIDNLDREYIMLFNDIIELD